MTIRDIISHRTFLPIIEHTGLHISECVYLSECICSFNRDITAVSPLHGTSIVLTCYPSCSSTV